VVDTLAEQTELEVLGPELCKVIAEGMHCERVSIFRLDRKDSTINSLHVMGLDQPLSWSIQGERPGLAGLSCRADTPVRVTDAYRHPNFNPVPDRETGFITRSVLSVPLHESTGNVWGCIQLLNKKGVNGIEVSFTEKDEEAMVVICGHCSHAIENIRLHSLSLDLLTRATRSPTAPASGKLKHAATSVKIAARFGGGL